MARFLPGRSITARPTVVETGDPVTITGTVECVCDGDQCPCRGNRDLLLRAAGELVLAESIPVLNDGGRHTAEIDVVFTEPGEHRVQVCSATSGFTSCITGTAEATTVQVSGPVLGGPVAIPLPPRDVLDTPKRLVDSFTLASSFGSSEYVLSLEEFDTTAGELDVVVDLERTGDGAVAEVLVQAFVNDGLFGQERTTPAEGGQTLRFEGVGEPGDEILVVATATAFDGGRAVVSSVAEPGFDPRRLETVGGSCSLDVAEVGPGDEVVATVDVRNGNGASGRFDLELTMQLQSGEPRLLGETTGLTLRGGRSGTFSVEGVADFEGRGEVLVTAIRKGELAVGVSPLRRLRSFSLLPGARGRRSG